LLNVISCSDHVVGDHPKTAEAIARKINLILGDTRATLAAKTGRDIDGIYEDEASAIVIHGDDIDELQGWQWDQSKIFASVCSLSLSLLTV
jgi:sodium/potassium-transporting ATPase subunit alpha